MKTTAFWILAPCSSVAYLRFADTCCLHHQGDSRDIHIHTCTQTTLQSFSSSVKLRHTEVRSRRTLTQAKQDDVTEELTRLQNDTPHKPCFSQITLRWWNQKEWLGWGTRQASVQNFSPKTRTEAVICDAVDRKAISKRVLRITGLGAWSVAMRLWIFFNNVKTACNVTGELTVVWEHDNVFVNILLT
jgi:hypothetical protein